MKAGSDTVVATVDLARSAAPKELHVKFRLPRPASAVTVNGRPATFGGSHNDTVLIATGSERHFEVVARS